MTTNVESGVLQWLDFDYAAPCDVRRCDNGAASTTLYVAHEECNAHNRWYALCAGHTLASLAGETRCRKCAEPLDVRNVLYL